MHLHHYVTLVFIFTINDVDHNNGTLHTDSFVERFCKSNN